MDTFRMGQRWISEMEPELGLGIILKVEQRTLSLLFPGSNDIRQYAIESAPLRRVRFRVGDRVVDQGGGAFFVDEVSEKDGLLVYHGDGRLLPESQLSDSLSFSTPEERLLNAQSDRSFTFDLRIECLQQRDALRRSPQRGLLGGRIDLIPHQFYIANEIARRQLPRVLLSDEVGLGKTIEACLVLHRLLINGQIGRVLILVPPSLVHQWFLELMRRFNLSFRLVDELFCEGVQDSSPNANPFLQDQLALCSIDFLRRDGKRQEQALEAGWDLLIVDEAHHVKEGSREYQLLMRLSGSTPRVLLLTATPEKLGLQSHFARLRLLDSARYPGFQQFRREAGDYARTAGLAAQLLDGAALSDEQLDLLYSLLADEPLPQPERLQRNHLTPEERDRLIDALIDRHGTGRVMFRNTRNVIKGFPRRLPEIIELKDSSADLHRHLREEFLSDTRRGHAEPSYELRRDARIKWLADLLRDLPEEKILLITRTRSRAEAIQDAVQQITGSKTALFHENMSLIQRDRNAAWFAQPDGAQLLICSEIGSEGRNFQFSHNLVLFDLPLDPELLEQRIGRLDRIGQNEDINILIPVFAGSPQSYLARWYDEGLDALTRHFPGGQQVLERFGSEVRDMALTDDTSAARQRDQLIRESQEFCRELRQTLEQGRDRLLEISSFRADLARELVSTVRDIDRDNRLQIFMGRIFDHYGIQYQDLSQRISILRAGDMRTDAFPAFDEKGMRVTFDRRIALSREDINFLSWDHPMVDGAIELMLGSEEGNCAVTCWDTDSEETFYVEAYFVAECVAPKQLAVERFFPPTPVRVIVNDVLEECTAEMPRELLLRYLRDVPAKEISEDPDFMKYRFGEMLAQCQEFAEELKRDIVRSSVSEMEMRLGGEVRRLNTLQQVNPAISAAELEAAEMEVAELRKYIQTARLRLDAIRVIRKGR